MLPFGVPFLVEIGRRSLYVAAHGRREADEAPGRGNSSPRMPPESEFGLTPRELAALRRLSPPWRIQRFLDDLRYDARGRGCRSPRRVLRERAVQCMDGALFAAAALRVQ